MPRISLRLNDKQYKQLLKLSQKQCCDRSNYLRLLIHQESQKLEKYKCKEKNTKSMTTDLHEKLTSLLHENLILIKFLVLSKNQTLSNEELKEIINFAKSKATEWAKNFDKLIPGFSAPKIQPNLTQTKKFTFFSKVVKLSGKSCNSLVECLGSV